MKLLKNGSNNALVSILQKTLNSLNLYNGNIDSIFGNNTLNAVKKFQSMHNLKPDGIVGNLTWNELLNYIPVPTDVYYTYDILKLVLKSLIKKYPILSTKNIGSSVMDKDIPCIKFGKGNKNILYVAGTHANEWICCTVLIKFIENLCNSYYTNTPIINSYAKDIYEKATIYIIPMLNPDGIDLVNNAINKNSKEYINAKKIADKFPNIRFPDGWKANILGIDLNLQFPAKWEEARKIKFSQGYTTYAPRDFVGKYPLQAREALNLYDFTINTPLDIMLTFHTQGEVIYYKYLDFNPPNSQKIGERLSNLSGYKLEITPYSSSFAGYKDWFIQTYNLPGYTIEVGKGTNPLPLSQFSDIYSKTLPMLEQTPFLI